MFDYLVLCSALIKSQIMILVIRARGKNHSQMHFNTFTEQIFIYLILVFH